MLQQATETPLSCDPQNAAISTEEPCPGFVGWRFTGSGCTAIQGCRCVGDDCDTVAEQTSWLICMTRHRGCCATSTPTPGTPGNDATPTPVHTVIDAPTATPGGANDTDTPAPPNDTVTPATPPPPADTPTPEGTAGPTAPSCACWPQDVAVATGTACAVPTSDYGWRHVGHGVCEHVLGCGTPTGMDGGQLFGSAADCAAAYAECACIACEPEPQPSPVPSGTECPTCVGESGLLDWREWYPMDRGQEPGERALNWWTDSSNSCLYRGQSTWNFDGIPAPFPVTRTLGVCIDYYFNWACRYSDEHSDRDCNDYRAQMEIISERRDCEGHALQLDHWGIHTEGNWQVFYDPLKLGTQGACDCTEDHVAQMQMTPGAQAANLVPLVRQMPCRPGEYIDNPVVCTANYVYGEDESGQQRGWDLKWLGIPDSTASSVGLKFVRNRLLEYLSDPGESCNIAHMLNEYYTTACDVVDAECGDRHAGDMRCENVESDPRAKRFTFRFEQSAGEIRAVSTPTGTPTVPTDVASTATNIPAPTTTYTPTITLTPTASDTPTFTPIPSDTPVPTPDCASRVANRECPAWGEECFDPPCSWLFSVVPPTLGCDPEGWHRLKLTATECGDPSGVIADVYAWFTDDLGLQGPFAMDAFVADGKRMWRLPTGVFPTGVCARGMPTEFTIQWQTDGHSVQTKGIGTLEVEYCCALGGCS